jgi:hypothetical protein
MWRKTFSMYRITAHLFRWRQLRSHWAIQQAALELCKGMWLARQRDPSVTMESVPDVYTVQYGAKNGGLLGAIPPNVQELLLPYKEFKL